MTESDDPENWTDAQMDKYIIDKITEVSKNMPWDTVILSLVFTYAWWRAYGQGPLPTKGDVMLGITYAVTIPKALTGGEVAAGFAIVALETLTIGIITPPEVMSSAKDAISIIVDPLQIWPRITDVASNIPSWVEQLVKVIPTDPIVPGN